MKYFQAYISGMALTWMAVIFTKDPINVAVMNFPEN